MKKIYRKLIRDRIPEIIRANGSICEIDVMDEQSYRVALSQKLIEEALEAAAAASERDLVTELADLYEVVDALMACYHISPTQVHREQIQRRTIRGGFSQRIRLLSTTDL